MGKWGTIGNDLMQGWSAYDKVVNTGNNSANTTVPSLISDATSSAVSGAASNASSFAASNAANYALLGNSQKALESAILNPSGVKSLAQIGAEETAKSTSAVASGLSSAAKAGIGAGITMAGTVGKGLISDGFSTKTGNIIATVGNLIGTGLSFVPGLGWAAGPILSAASSLVGGIVNRGWGHKVYGKAQAQNYLNNMSGFKVGGSNNDIENAMANITEADKVTYKDGWFTDKGKKEARSWNNKTAAAYDYALRSVDNAA